MRPHIEREVFEMITTLNEALGSCDQYRDSEGFCTRNCACSGMSFGGCTQAIHDAAREEAKKAGLDHYSVVSGNCGDWYIVKIDEMGRLI